MGFLRLTLTVIFLIYVVPRQSNASLITFFEKIGQNYDKSKATTDQASPSPSPVSQTDMNSGNNSSPVSSPKAETCDMVSYYKCDIMEYHISSCVPFLGNVSQEGYVLVMNDGESSRILNITVFPANQTLENIAIPGHQSKKVKLPSSVGFSYSSILLNSENGNCTIHMVASILDNFYTKFLTQINRTYLVFVSALFIGGTFICCKLGKKGRHLNGVKYRELEMGQQEPNPSFTIETTNDWDQEWDDDWDVEKQ